MDILIALYFLFVIIATPILFFLIILALLVRFIKFVWRIGDGKKNFK
jgi:hypothetical protein